uniref:Secreted protein n=1 Tax=Rhizophora mucronata TaxID=61149 RepID=A0A2P2P362_RHIMU
MFVLNVILLGLTCSLFFHLLSCSYQRNQCDRSVSLHLQKFQAPFVKHDLSQSGTEIEYIELFQAQEPISLAFLNFLDLILIEPVAITHKD